MRVILCVLLCGLCSLYATLADYQFSYSESGWQELSQGTALGNVQTDNQYFVNPALPNGGTVHTGIGLPLGFDFNFDGDNFDRFGVCADGWIGLGKSSYGNQAVILSWTNNQNPLNYTYAHNGTEDRIARIAGFARDLQAQAGASLRYATLGAEPERVLVIEWKNYRRINANNEYLSFQIRLHEGSNMVEVVFGPMQVSLTGIGQIGMRNLPANEATNFACRTTSNGFSNSEAGINASAGAILSPTNYPVSGATFAWTPALSLNAAFMALPLSGYAPLSVQFQDQSIAAATPIQSWNWSFGDGGTSTLQNPTHIYQSSGVYSVSLAIYDETGSAQTSKSDYIQVHPAPFGSALSMTMQDYDAHLSWEHITSDAQGNPFQPTYYYLYFNGSANPEGEFYFLAPIEYPNQSYIHQGVGRGAKHMFYKLKAVDNQ